MSMLRTFNALATEASTARAAATLGITQSALSQSIDSLERLLGAELFARTPRGMVLTPAGELLRDDGLSAVRAFVEALHTLGLDTSQSTVVTVAFTVTTEYQLLPELANLVANELPGLQLAYRRMWTTEIPRALESGEIDIGFARHPEVWGDLRVELLWESPLTVMVPDTHRLADRGHISLKELDGEPLSVVPRSLSPGAFDIVESACLRAGFQPVFVSGSQSGRTGSDPLLQRRAVALGPELMAFEVPAGIRVLSVEEPVGMGLHVICRHSDLQRRSIASILALSRALALRNGR